MFGLVGCHVGCLYPRAHISFMSIQVALKNDNLSEGILWGRTCWSLENGAQSIGILIFRLPYIASLGNPPSRVFTVVWRGEKKENKDGRGIPLDCVLGENFLTVNIFDLQLGSGGLSVH